MICHFIFSSSPIHWAHYLKGILENSAQLWLLISFYRHRKDCFWIKDWKTKSQDRTQKLKIQLNHHCPCHCYCPKKKGHWVNNMWFHHKSMSVQIERDTVTGLAPLWQLVQIIASRLTDNVRHAQKYRGHYVSSTVMHMKAQSLQKSYLKVHLASLLMIKYRAFGGGKWCMANPTDLIFVLCFLHIDTLQTYRALFLINLQMHV